MDFRKVWERNWGDFFCPGSRGSTPLMFESNGEGNPFGRLDSNPHVPINKNAGGETFATNLLKTSVGKYDPNARVNTIRRIWDSLHMGTLDAHIKLQ